MAEKFEYNTWKFYSGRFDLSFFNIQFGEKLHPQESRCLGAQSL
jgi:hypothetical protein